MRFRVRSLERDHDADARRLSSIERPLSIAIAEAKSEMEGLRRRIEVSETTCISIGGRRTTRVQRPRT